jgi:hypothetical protein
VGLLASSAYGVPLIGTVALLPLLIQRLLGYPAMTAGLLFTGDCKRNLACDHRRPPDAVRRLALSNRCGACADGDRHAHHVAHYSLFVDAWGSLGPALLRA